MNPCKCGYYPDLHPLYLHGTGDSRVSAPDQPSACWTGWTSARRCRGFPFEELLEKQPREEAQEEDSAAIRSRVEKGAEASGCGVTRGRLTAFNGDLDSAGVQKYCALGAAEEKILEGMYRKFSLTARSCHRLLKGGPYPGRYG